MPEDVLSEVISSANSLGIAALISIRPRTQSELAEITGVSVPAVLMHLKRLRQLGVIEENKIKGNLLGVRRIYTARNILVGDFSLPSLKVVKLASRSKGGGPTGDPISTMERTAESLLLQRRRIREHVRRLGRLIDDLLEDQARLSQMAELAGDGVVERLVLETMFTEEDPRDAERALARHYGLKGGRRSIERVMKETKRFGKK